MVVIEKNPEQLLDQFNRARDFFNVLGFETIPSEEHYRIYLAIDAKLAHFPQLPDSNTRPTITPLAARTRGETYLLQFGGVGNEKRIIKRIESPLEQGIAHLAGEMGIGPKQFQSRSGFLHEEFIEGTPLIELRHEDCSVARMRELGAKFATHLLSLHNMGILINDQALCDDYGNTHLIIDRTDNLRLIDFGASIMVNEYPNITDEAVLNLIRTDPFLGFVGNVDTQAYRNNRLSKIKSGHDLAEAIDYQLLSEGLHFLNMRLPNVEHFASAVKETLV